jgi:hypothetical protein
MYHFFRSNGKTYWGMNTYKTQCNCKAVFLGKTNNNVVPNNETTYYVNNLFMEKYNYSKNKKHPQSGSIAFEYFKDLNIFNKNDQIFLVGFTSIYKNGLWNGHSKELEDNYFSEQMNVYNVTYMNDHL